MRITKNHTDPNKELDKLLVEQSSGLLEAMQRGGDAERHTLASWLLQSKRHVRTHLLMTALEEELKQVDPERRMAIPDLSALKADPSPLPWRRALSALHLPSTEFAPPKRGRQRIWAAAAVVVITAAATLFTFNIGRTHQWQEFKTAIGEQRAVTLADGSVIQLNTESRVKVRLSAALREIRLLDGEALFKVQKDHARPFNVYTSDATIVAVGTQFNVYQLNGRTKVSVLEGRVQVSAGDEPPALQAPSATGSASPTPVLGAGEEAEIRKDGQIARRQAPNVADTAAWTQRRVVFKQEALVDVIAEFNRYRKTPQFRVEDGALAARRYSGIFDIDDPRSLDDVLSNERDIVLDRTGDEIVVRLREKTDGTTSPQ